MDDALPAADAPPKVETPKKRLRRLHDLLCHHIQADDIAGIDQALAQGAQINGVDEELRTPLHLALRNETIDCMAHLLKLGANPDVPECAQAGSKYTQSALSHAIHFRTELLEECMAALLAAGADTQAKDIDGNTPLAVAVRCGRREAVKILCDAGGDLDACGALGHSALHVAGQKNDIESVRILLAAGAKTEPLTQRGPSALFSTAVHRGQAECLQAIVDAGGELTSAERASLRPFAEQKEGYVNAGVIWLIEREAILEEARQISASAKPSPDAAPPRREPRI